MDCVKMVIGKPIGVINGAKIYDNVKVKVDLDEEGMLEYIHKDFTSRNDECLALQVIDSRGYTHRIQYEYKPIYKYLRARGIQKWNLFDEANKHVLNNVACLIF